MTEPVDLNPVVEHACRVFDLTFEVSSLLDDLAALDPMPRFAFSLSRYVERVLVEVDGLHTALLRLRDAQRGAS